MAAEATGWDARLLALAASAAKLSTDTGVPAKALYALFRAGLPLDPEPLFRLNPKLVDAALRRAAAAGIIDGGNGAIAEAVKAFQAHARSALDAAKAPGAAASLGELLDAAELPPPERRPGRTPISPVRRAGAVEGGQRRGRLGRGRREAAAAGQARAADVQQPAPGLVAR